MLIYQSLNERLSADLSHQVLTSVNYEKCVFLIHHLIYKSWKHDRYKVGGWVNIHSEQMRRMLGGSYKNLVSYLKSIDAIESREQYSNSSKAFSKSYRIGSLYFQTSPLVSVEAKTHVATKVIHKLTPNEREERLEQSPVYVRQMFENYPSLTIDTNKIHILIEEKTEKAEMMSHHDTKMLYHFALDAMLGQQQTVACSTDEYGRVHYPLTYNPALFRLGCSRSGERLVELDIANSQLLPLCLLLRESKYELEQDVQLFIHHSQSGNVYDILMETTGYKPEERTRFKQDFFGLIYTSCALMKRSTLYAPFKASYPNVLRFIEDYKVLDYKQLPRDMQKRESDLMIHSKHSVLQQILAQSIFIITIHDAIAVPEQHADEAEKAIRFAFANHNLSCRIKTTIWK